MASYTHKRRLSSWLFLFASLSLLQCGRDTPTRQKVVEATQALQAAPGADTKLWPISGSVSNANPNAWVAVQNANDLLYVYGTNNFTFPTFYVNNTPYAVTIAGADPSLICGIANANGIVSGARIDNVTVSCSTRPVAQFMNGFETFDQPTDWENAVDDSWGSGGLNQVTGYCCGMPGPQGMTTAYESAHTGNGAFVFSGMAYGNLVDQRAYLKIFDLSSLYLVGGAYLSYWIFPQSGQSVFGGGVVGEQSAYSAVDITLLNGTALHILPGILDQFGNSIACIARQPRFRYLGFCAG